ncbi:MAG: response regulator [Patescibacteria group bacterium]
MSSDLRIVLIEDEPSLVSLYSFGLHKIGQVLAASTKQDAFELFERLLAENKKPSVVLLDLILPGARTEAVKFRDRAGFEILQWLRQNKWYELVPVIIMTNLDNNEDRQMAETLGANGYIVKSNVVPKQIVEEINALV